MRVVSHEAGVKTHSLGFLTQPATSLSFALVVLNVEPQSAGAQRAAARFENCWGGAAVRVCADGGANRLHDAQGEQERERRLPDLITGDLDSLRPDVERYYAGRDVAIEGEAEQDTNDFEKCLRWLERRHARGPPGAPPLSVVAHGAFGGRLDQQMANLNMLYRYASSFESFVLLCESSAAFLLPPGRHVLLPNRDAEDGSCGLIPLGGRCERVLTSGLRWDLDGTRPLEFGGLVSSSNEVVGERVTIETSGPLLWTAGLRQD